MNLLTCKSYSLMQEYSSLSSFVHNRLACQINSNTVMFKDSVYNLQHEYMGVGHELATFESVSGISNSK